MIKFKYTIQGFNPTTQRKNKRTFTAFNEGECELLAREGGLVEPFEILAITKTLASENQINYAQGLGILLSPEAQAQEVSDMISFKVNSDAMPHLMLKEYAEQNAIEFSDAAGERAIATKLLEALNLQKRIAFYYHTIHSRLLGQPIIPVESSANQSAFIEFADEMSKDLKFIDSFGRDIYYKQHDQFAVLFGADHLESFFTSRAYANEKARNYLRYKFGPIPRKYFAKKSPDELELTATQSPQEHSQAKQKNGCFPVVLFLSFSVLLILVLMLM